MTSGDDALLIHAALDGELDAAGMLRFEARLAEDAALAGEYACLQALRGAIRNEIGKPAAPEALRQRIGAMVAAPMRTPRRDSATSWRAMAASALIAAGLASSSTWLALRPDGRGAGIGDALLDDHKRGILSGHPVDVASSNRHTVKPWFTSHFALAPSVADLSGKGFPLVGGRIDIVKGAPAATLVYRHNEHFISLTALPGQAATQGPARTVDGYSSLAWRAGGADYLAISDIDPAELARFRQAFDAAIKEG